MSTTEHKLPLYHAQRLANRLVEILSPHCERIDIAGSIRRQKQEVGDIEIVCEPKKISTDIFGGEKKPILEFWAVLRRISLKTLMGKADGTGRYYKFLLPSGIGANTVQLDLFIPQPADYYRQLAIRTGSSNYSANVIAVAWCKNGWVGTADGLRIEAEVEKKGENWVCTLPEPTLPPVWQTEREFFDWLGIEWVEPKMRF